MPEIMVSVGCTVYNHERYLRKCLESLVMQKTAFPYEVIVHDDASTDSSAAIIREFAQRYPDKIVPIYQTENQYSKGISPLAPILAQARGRYVALCEGDDFWTSADKLQKQVDFLEQHPDFSLCAHAAYCAHEDSSFYRGRVFRPYSESREVSVPELLSGWKFATNSLFYRRSAQKEPVPPFQGDCPSGDFALTAYLALKGRVYYLDELLSAYRVDSVGSINWTFKDDMSRHIVSRQKFIAMLHRIDDYTAHQYSDTIRSTIEQSVFDIHVLQGQLDAARRDTARYRALPPKQKAELWLHNCAPTLFALYRKAVATIKHAKYHL